MQVTLIGSGNVATVLGRQWVACGHTVAEVYSRNNVHASALAKELHAGVAAGLQSLRGGSDVYLLAVNDDAMEEVAAGLSLGDALLVHTAGSVSKEILRSASTNYGVLWPMKMIRRSMETLGRVTLVTDGNTEDVRHRVQALAGLFSATVIHARDEKRLQMHMLASFTANFSNHLYHLAADYCLANGIDFNLFLPIIEATVQNLYHHHPREVQAGPAFRGDEKTMQKHLALLQNHPAAEKLYRLLSRSIADAT